MHSSWVEYELRNEFVLKMIDLEQPVCGELVAPTRVEAHEEACTQCRTLNRRRRL